MMLWCDLATMRYASFSNNQYPILTTPTVKQSIQLDQVANDFFHQNPQTGQPVQGYYITAYRNLTTVSLFVLPLTASLKTMFAILSFRAPLLKIELLSTHRP
jgi:hypothetical protein